MEAARRARACGDGGGRPSGASGGTLAGALLLPLLLAGCGDAGVTIPVGTQRDRGAATAETRDSGPQLDPSDPGAGLGSLMPRDAGAPPPPPPHEDPLPVSCDEVVFDPCGGDPVGRWSVRLGCVDYEGRSPYADCPDADVLVAMVMTGTLEIRADGSYTSATDIASTTTLRVPPACVGGSCDALGAGARAEAGVCVQNLMDHKTPTDEGSWRFEGGFVVLQTGDEDTRYQHCVDGDVLYLRSPAPGPNDSTVSIVLERLP